MVATVSNILSDHTQTPFGERAALLSAAKFLRSRFDAAPCDSPGVSNCVRCTAVYLAKRVEKLVALNEEQHSPVEREGE